MDPRSGNRVSGPSTELISPREFLQSWNLEALEAVHTEGLMVEDEINECIAKKMDISQETAQELSFVCRKDALFCGLEPQNRFRMLEMKSAPEKAEKELQSLRIQIETRDKRSVNPSLKAAVNRRMKYNVMDEYMTVVPVDSQAPVEDKQFQVQVPNVVLTVQITKCLCHGEPNTKIRESETYLVLATQPLTALRDKVRCSSDSVIAGDFSALPDVDISSLQKAGDIYKSSFFFIENVFYNDLRLPDNKDYSKPVIEWAKEIGAGSDFTTARMEEVTLYDLRIRLGHYYLFMHQGNCEHAVLFTDMRLFSSDDLQDVRKYPYMTLARLKNRSVCQGCSKISAKWIVQGASILPSDPCSLCKMCFKTLLYNKKGEKLYNFTAHLHSDFYN